MSNIGPSILSKLDRKLYMQDQHPLCIVKNKIYEYFKERGFSSFDHFNPLVTVAQNFDALNVPWNHPSRKPSDTYYLNNQHLLRTHMTANEPEFIKMGHRAFVICGDVYRRDEIDSTHYPVFHQLEGVHIFDSDQLHLATRELNHTCPFADYGFSYNYETQHEFDEGALKMITSDLHIKLSGLMRHLFGPHIRMRWNQCYFPFTTPSYEIEIFYRDRWVEVCGSGVLMQSILQECGAPATGWAFGLGLERIAMVLYDIPDIRWFWSEDPRFIRQFSKTIPDLKFVPFSKYPPINRDLSFWLAKGEHEFEMNSLCDLVRAHSGDLVEEVELIDVYQDKSPNLNRVSHCYRITYRAIDRTLTDSEVNAMQERIQKDLESIHGVILR